MDSDIEQIKKACCKSRPVATSKGYQRDNYVLKCYVCYNNVNIIIRSTFDWVSLFPALTHNNSGCIRQVIILHNLVNWVTFFLTGYQTLIGQRTFFVQQFSDLIITIDSPFMCDYFLYNDFTPIYDRSQDIRIQIFRKSTRNLTKLQQAQITYTFFSFTKFNKSNVLIIYLFNIFENLTLACLNKCKHFHFDHRNNKKYPVYAWNYLFVFFQQKLLLFPCKL